MVDSINSIDPKQRIVFTPFLFILGFAASWKNLSSLAYQFCNLKEVQRIYRDKRKAITESAKKVPDFVPHSDPVEDVMYYIYIIICVYRYYFILNYTGLYLTILKLHLHSNRRNMLNYAYNLSPIHRNKTQVIHYGSMKFRTSGDQKLPRPAMVQSIPDRHRAALDVHPSGSPKAPCPAMSTREFLLVSDFWVKTQG